MSILLRRATAVDAPALARLSGTLGYPAQAADVAQRLQRLSRERGNVLILAQSADGTVIGWVHAFGTYRLECDPFCELGGLVVEESHRGSGVGRALVDAAEAWGRRSGFHQLRVRSNVLREEAHAFYVRLGYRKAKTQAVYVRALRNVEP